LLKSTYFNETIISSKSRSGSTLALIFYCKLAKTPQHHYKNKSDIYPLSWAALNPLNDKLLIFSFSLSILFSKISKPFFEIFVTCEALAMHASIAICNYSELLTSLNSSAKL